MSTEGGGWTVRLLLGACTLIVEGGCDTPSETQGQTGNGATIAAPTSPWQYAEQQDPITKVSTGSAKARLTGNLPGVISEVAWSCPGKGVENLVVEVDTYHEDGSALAQDQSTGVSYRFDGTVTGPGTGGPLARTKREYRNAVIVQVPAGAGWADEHKFYGGIASIKITHPYTMNADAEYVSFKIVDADFAIKVRVDGGDESLTFSLDDPAIKKVLVDCGYTFDVAPTSPKG